MATEAADRDKIVTPTGSEEAPPAPSGVLNLPDPQFIAHAYATYAELRAKGPVVRVSIPRFDAEGDDDDHNFRDIYGREAFFVTRYEEAAAALLDERFSVDPRATMTPEEIARIPPMPEEFRPFSRGLLSIDPPDHTRLRKLVQPSFTPQAMERLRPRIQRIADDLLDSAEREAADRGAASPDRRMDLMEAYAYPMPVAVISDMLGVPSEDRAMMRGWTEQLLTNGRGREFADEGRAKLKELLAYLRDLFAEKRRRPTDDLISQLVHAQEDGDVLDDDELLSMVFIVYLAGHATTVNLIGNGVVALLTHPAERARLDAKPELVRGVVEETLRYWGPVDLVSRRIAMADIEVGGTRIAKGERMMVGLASTGRDPQRFANPDEFDITRADANRHMAFGKGIHLCLGAPLARVEGQIAFETLFRRFPKLRLAIPAEDLRWSSNTLRGFTWIPVLF